MGNKSHFFRQSSGGGGDAFIATFRTTTDNESITLPYVSNGTYSGTIDWGDGTIVENTYENRTHTYINSGDYDVTILGECVGFNFVRVGFSVNKIINIKQWGSGFKLLDDVNGGYFRGCRNLNITASDVLNLEQTTILNDLFVYNNILEFNDTINNWDTSNITNMKQVFYDCYLFNQPLNNWGTRNVISMNRLFSSARLFNQDISTWDFSGLNLSDSLFRFMIGKTFNDYNPEYYDNLLIKWASSPNLGGLQPNVIGTIDMGSIKYTANGASARQSILDNNKAVTITDGGQI